MKKCSTCQTEKTLEEFHPSKAGAQGRQSNCRVCVKLRNKTREARKNDPNSKHIIAKALAARGLRKCTRCKEVLDRSMFYVQKKGLDGRTSTCKKCNTKDRNKLYNDPIKGQRMKKTGAEWKMKRQYGVSVAEYDAMLVRQGHACACCRKPIFRFNSGAGKKAAHVDHCHESGLVRGLLCGHCNVSIGMAGDNIWVLEQMIGYLERCSNLSNTHSHFVAPPAISAGAVHTPQGVNSNKEEKMAADNLLNFLTGLSKAKPSGGAWDSFRDGRYRLCVKKMVFEKKLKETIFKTTFTVVNSTKITVQSVKTGEKLDIEPNRPGSDVDWVATKLTEIDSPGPGNIRRLMMDLFNEREISDELYFETLAEMTDYGKDGNPLPVPLELAKGLLLDMETTRIETKKNKKEIVVCKWSHVPSAVEKGPQTEAERAAMIGWLNQVATQQAATQPQASA